MGLRGGAGVKNCCPIGRGGLAAAAAAGPMKLGGRGAAYTPEKKEAAKGGSAKVQEACRVAAKKPCLHEEAVLQLC